MMWTALLLGFGGSLHCAGMCSPLVMAVTNFSRRTFVNRMVYNTGRIIVYGVMGTLVTLLGSSLSFLNFQNGLSIGLGILLVLIGVGTITSVRIPFLTNSVNRLVVFIKIKFATVLASKQRGATFLLGMLNGLLPCGLVYLVLSYTLTLSSPMEGFLFMILFGVGTLPVMVGIPMVMKLLSAYVTIRFSKVATVVLIATGVLLIARTTLPHIHTLPSIESEPVVCR